MKKILFLFFFVLLFFYPGAVKACYQLDSSQAIPAGFGAAYDVLSPGLETLILADCSTPSVEITAGNGSNYQYIYENGYFYRDGAWESFTFSNYDPDPENVWIVGEADVSIALSEAERLASNYVVVYICTWNGTEWKCGCRDSACTDNYWQLQIFEYPVSTCEDNDGDGYDSCMVGEFGDDGKQKDCDDDNDWANPGGFEVCDTVDNDCNGSIDEGCDDDGDGYCDSTMSLYGGNSMCLNNVYNGDGTQGRDCDDSAVDINPGVSETCDGIDNNCDKNTDEGCVCVDNDGDGYDTCNPGDLGDDGLVEDCNDNSWDRSPGAIEICDSVDNNCDDNIDEGGVCCVDTDGDGYDGCSVGETGDDGKQIDCDDAQWFKNPGAPETCDNYDNNCNGTIDENCDNDGDGYCTSAIRFYNYPVSVCPNTNLPNDSFGNDCDDSNYNSNPGKTEVCDGVDNDCDGTVDEDCNCLDGETQVCGSDVGACQTGMQTCTGGIWSSCVGEVIPVAEICDAVDNNCDGTIDEGCECTNGQTQVCGSDVGACQTGNQICVDGVWGSCVGEIVPVSEICSDMIDNNCDGTVNEGCVYCYDNDGDSYDDCSLGDMGDDGKQADCDDQEYWANPGAVENCDTIDNDCDSDIDEGCDDDGDGYCDSNSLIYNNNSMCPNSLFSGDGSSGDDCNDNLSNTYLGAIELCGDGIDNNCDTYIDEGCVCLDGGTQTCGSSDVGICTFGTQFCEGGSWGECIGSVGPVEEICANGLDDNCDGEVDEGCGSTFELYVAEPQINEVSTLGYINFVFNAIGGKTPYLYTIEENGVPVYEGYNEYFGMGGGMGGTSELTAGVKTFTITAKDMDGKEVSKQISIEVLPSEDLFLQLYSPQEGNKFSKDTFIYFNCYVSGGTAPYSYKFSSDLDGVLSTERYFSTNTLSTGNHIITAEVVDSLGATYSSSANIEVVEDMVVELYPPVASYEQGEDIYFSINPIGGTSPYTLSFVSDVDGYLGNTARFDSSRMTLGVHNITLDLVDANGNEGTGTAIFEISPAVCHDEDGDGYGYTSSLACATLEIDCNDSNQNISPGMEEDCYNNIDDDCDSYIDECSIPPTLLLPATDGTNVERGEDFTVRVEAPNARYVKVNILDPEGTNVKILYLADDGAHNDGEAGDNIWGGIWTATGSNGGIYSIDVSVYIPGIGYTDYEDLRTFNLIDSPQCINFINNGDSGDKLDIVFVADQYTSDEMSTFADKALTSANYFSGIYPMSDNTDKINYSRVEIVQDLGCKDGDDCFSGNIFKAAASCPYDTVVLLVDNNFRSYAYLGSHAVVDANDSDYYWVVTHELGHAFARLYDEYVEAGVTRTEASVNSSVNCEVSSTCEKWAGVPETGCYSGCAYSTDYYRSFYNGIMRSHSGTEFGPVSEAHMLDLLNSYN